MSTRVLICSKGYDATCSRGVDIDDSADDDNDGEDVRLL